MKKLKKLLVMENFLKELYKLLKTQWVNKSVILISNAWKIFAIKLLECSNSEDKSKNILKEEWKSLHLTLPHWLDRQLLLNLSHTLDLSQHSQSILHQLFKSSELRKHCLELLNKKQKHQSMVFFTILPLLEELWARTKERSLVFWLTNARWLQD